MPQRPKRSCKSPGCPTLCETGWCDKHRNDDRKLYDQRRGSAHSRGYDRRWMAFRLRYLAANPLCIDCLDKDVVTLAREIHHVAKLADAPALKYEDSNLKALCKACHAARTLLGE